ncbi:MAG TPA: PaaI family thioesterase [Acidimicrobiales bacterium]
MADGSGPAQDLVEMMSFARWLGIRVDEARPACVRGSVDWSADRCTTGGVLHGGVLMGLADTLGAICAFLNLPDGATTSTIESKTNFFRAVRDGALHGVASPVHVGRTTIVVQTELRDDTDRLAGLVVQTQAVLGDRS